MEAPCMKVILKLMISIIFIGVGNYSICQKVDSIVILNDKKIDLKNEEPVFNYLGKRIGKRTPMDKVENLDNYPRLLSYSKISLNNGREINITPLAETIICEEVQRVITTGSFDYGYHQQGTPYLIIYDFNGNLISNKGPVTIGGYKVAVSIYGDIYLSGEAKDENNKHIRKIVKTDKDGNKLWEVNLEGIHKVQDIKISKSGDKIVVIQTGSSNKNRASSYLTIIDKNGKILNSTTDNIKYSSLEILGEDKILITYFGKFFIKSIQNLADIIPLNYELRTNHKGLIVSSNPRKNTFVTLNELGELQLLILNNKNELELLKRRKLNDLEIVKNFKSIKLI